MINHTTILRLFDGASGELSLVTPDDQEYVGNPREIAALSNELDDPWIDLVTTTGDAVGAFNAGDGTVVMPKPSLLVPGGMVHLFDHVVPGQTRGLHLCPLSALQDIDSLTRHDPATRLRTPASDLRVALSTGRRRDETQGKWKETTSTFEVFADFLMTHTVGQKDGPCYLQGTAAGGVRKSSAMTANTVLCVDLDSGEPLETVIEKIAADGAEAIIHSSHSHMKDMSEIKLDHFLKWADDGEISPSLAARYLVEVKGVLPEIVSTLEIVEERRHTSDGIVMVVRHQPIQKFRVIFPLSEPFEFAKRGGTHQDAIAEWKERYAGFCAAKGFFYDEKCVDPARLFYAPRHAESAPFGAWRVYGAPTDLDQVERVKVRRGAKRGGLAHQARHNAFTMAANDVAEDTSTVVANNGFNLRAWAARHGKRFEVQTMLEDVVDPDFIREARTSGYGVHVECPFEAEHSSLGGNGTYVVNASDNLEDGREGGFTFHCMHNACAGRDRLDYLKELLDNEVISVDDLNNPDYRFELADDDASDVGETVAESRVVKSTGAAAQSRKAPSEANDEATMMDYFNGRYALVTRSGKASILREPRNPKEMPEFFTEQDVGRIERPKWYFEKTASGARRVRWFNVWMESDTRRSYDAVGFDPGNTDPTYYNLFRGFPYDPEEGDCDLIRRHIFEVLCGGDAQLSEWLMTFLAHMVQFPKSKPGVALVLQGEKGTGKSTIFEDLMHPILGNTFQKVSSGHHLDTRFNAEYERTIMLLCEEAFWAGDPSKEGQLKDLITGPSLRIEPKGVNAYNAPSCLRVVLVSNNRHVVPASVDERRFVVLKASSRYRGDKAYFDALHAEIRSDKARQAFMYVLMSFQPKGGWGCVHHAPRTAGLDEQIVASFRGPERFIHYLLVNGSYDSDDLPDGGISLREDQPTDHWSIHLRAAIRDFLADSHPNERNLASTESIDRAIEDWFGVAARQERRPGMKNRQRVYTLPSLAVARDRVLAKKGLRIDPSYQPSNDDADEGENVIPLRRSSR
jgi:hypothetical protein